MIRSLYIRNYLLIDQLELDFSSGFITITGETGAGKSVLMGALSLILGQRVDSSVLKLKDSKCILEAAFRIDKSMEDLFREHDLDFEGDSTLRREIAPGGKSRAFINDTPVNLGLLKLFGQRLVDIHSQHQNLQLNDHQYQMEVLNHLARNEKELLDYTQVFEAWAEKQKDLEGLKAEAGRLKEELDYMQFQYDELQAASLMEGEMDELESDLQRAEHAGEINLALGESNSMLAAEEHGVLDLLRSTLNHLQKIAPLYAPARGIADRMESTYIELKDLSGEVADLQSRSGVDPGQLEQLRERVDAIYGLMQKHRKQRPEELISLRDELGSRIEKAVFSDEHIARLEKETAAIEKDLGRLSAGLRKQRMKAGEKMQKGIEELLQQLGISQARFQVELNDAETYDRNGKDLVSFLFSANRQLPMEDLSRVASGGEVSRLMLSIKSLLSDVQGMPTLIFDEIDTGVSGEIADRVGIIMDKLSKGRQVIAITHLPQVAARGKEHFVVYKEETTEASFTRMKKLNRDERIAEIAAMLSGEDVSDAALSNAKILLRI